MAQFDVHRLSGGALLLDCQSYLLSGYNSRLAVPLIPVGGTLPAMARLNPIFEVDGMRVAMMTEFAAAVPTRDLGPAIASLAAHDLTIKSAIDVLTGGY